MLWHTGIEILHHVPDFRERAIVEKRACVLELPQRHHAEFEGVVIVESNLLPSLVVEIGIIPHQPSQCLERVVPNPDVNKILFHELTDSSNVRIIVLLIEHRSAMAGETTCATRRRGSKEQFGSTSLRGGQRT